MGEAQVEESFEVDDRGSSGESDLVAGDAAVAASSVAVGDEPGNGALDEWAVLSVVRNEVGVGAPAEPVGGEMLVVFADLERLAVDGCGAT